MTSDIVFGHVSPGFEPVRALFESKVASGAEDCAQLCVYAGGEAVVDLYAVARHVDQYTRYRSY